MGCDSCNSADKPTGCKNNGLCATNGCNKLSVFNWLSNMKQTNNPFQIFEVRFKNGRKGFFKNQNNISLNMGDIVVVQAINGDYNLGVISLSGELVRVQMRMKKIKQDHSKIWKIYRKATQGDLDLWKHAQEREFETMKKARGIAQFLKLPMKISDVEFQGDNRKAIFYYTSEGRIDFRQLIRELADVFQVRIEMKQIGFRQEAGRLGGIGSCGRELCCSTWLTDFRSVNTTAARYQQLSIAPQKLAGQCGKLKCCLNYELDAYMDALKHFPNTRIQLKTQKGLATFQKMDVFKEFLWYSYVGKDQKWIKLTVDAVKAVVEENKKGIVVADLECFEEDKKELEPNEFTHVVGSELIDKFSAKDKKKQSIKNKSKKDH